MIIATGISVDQAMKNLTVRARVSEMQSVDSRAGLCHVFPSPVTVQYEPNYNMWSRNPHRDANPFFHFIEALWMLAGRNDLKSLTNVLRNFSDYSDDGVTVEGAYGHRWRYQFGVDQLEYVIQCIRDPFNRRAVMTMWNPIRDIPKSLTGGRDVPCNIGVSFHTRDMMLEMSVFNRSNDMIFGMFGANAVHFGFLHRYVANVCGYGVGRYYQISTNCHYYHIHNDMVNRIWESEVPETHSEYPLPLLTNQDTEHMFRLDLAEFFDMDLSDIPNARFRTYWFNMVAVEVVYTYLERRFRNSRLMDNDVNLYRAINDWIERRK